MKIRSFLTRRLLPVAAIGTALVLIPVAASPAAAADKGRPLVTVLTGAAEVGGGDPDGAGLAAVRITPGIGRICYALAVINLDPVVGAHIHVGAAGVNGPVVVPLQPPTSGFSAACTDVDAALARDIATNSDQYYVNVHTTVFPGGAVRGQL
jgi:hypothetical protein